MISLIVSADDLGSNADRDRGILEAFNKGIVSSASLIANGSSFVTAVAQVKETGLPIGVHLNIAEGSTLTGVIKGLTDSAGQLTGKEKLRQCLADENCDRAALRNEIAAQIERIFNAGLQPDHLDSHQHCQLFPFLTTMLTELAREYNISRMRTSFPTEPAEQDPEGQLGEELALYRRLGQNAQTTTRGAGIKTPDGLYGMPLLNRLNTSNLCNLLENLSDGCWELMTHPGYPCDGGGPFDGQQRQVELQALRSTEAKEVVARRQIRLCSFGDLACAS